MNQTLIQSFSVYAGSIGHLYEEWGRNLFARINEFHHRQRKRFAHVEAERKFTISFIRSSIHSFIQSYNHSFIHSFIHSSIRFLLVLLSYLNILVFTLKVTNVNSSVTLNHLSNGRCDDETTYKTATNDDDDHGHYRLFGKNRLVSSLVPIGHNHTIRSIYGACPYVVDLCGCSIANWTHHISI